MNDTTTENLSAPQHLGPKWTGSDSVRLAHELNERSVDLFCDLAIDSRTTEWPFVTLNRDLWRRLDMAARKRLAMLPFTIVDLRFNEEPWWLDQDVDIVPSRDSTSASAIPPGYDHLALETLMFAWQVSRENRRVAQMIFGMRPLVARLISTLTMKQLRTIAAERAEFLTIRWSDRPDFWRELLIAAIDGDEAELAAIRRDANLLFCGMLIELHGR